MKNLSRFLFSAICLLVNSIIIGQNKSNHIPSTENQKLNFTCFIAQSFELLDSVTVRVFKGDTLLETKVSDEKGNVTFFLTAGEYDAKFERKGYKEKEIKKVKVTQGSSFGRILMNRDL